MNYFDLREINLFSCCGTGCHCLCPLHQYSGDHLPLFRCALCKHLNSLEIFVLRPTHTWYLSFWHQHHFQVTPKKHTKSRSFDTKKTQHSSFLHQNTPIYNILTPAPHVVHATNIRCGHTATELDTSISLWSSLWGKNNIYLSWLLLQPDQDHEGDM